MKLFFNKISFIPAFDCWTFRLGVPRVKNLKYIQLDVRHATIKQLTSF